MGVKKVKKLGGVKKGDVVNQRPDLTLAHKISLGRELLHGGSVKEMVETYGVTPQAVGWWKRLAEKEEMATQGLELLDKFYTNPEKDTEYQNDDIIMNVDFVGYFDLCVYVDGRKLLTLPGRDLRISRNLTKGLCTATWQEEE
jgi:hypothetical protein